MKDSATDLDTRRRAIRIRAWRRGMREMDLLIGSFVDAELDTLSARDVADLERLLDEDDQAVFTWLSGGAPTPEDWAKTPVLQAIKAFHTHTKPVHV